MPVVQTKGAASSQGFGEFAQQGGGTLYSEDVFSTYLYSGNGSAQTINNGILLGDGFVADGVSGGSGVFGGTACLTTTLNSSGVSLTGDMTFEGWMFPTSYGNNFVFAVGTTSGQRIMFQLYDNKAYVYYGDLVAYKATAQTQSSYLLDSWHHFAVVRNGNDVHCYIDGIDQGSYGSIATNPTGYDTIISAIDGSGSTAFVGNLSNVRFTKAALYTSSSIPPLTALTASANTGLLVCQGATPFVDNSGNSFSITQVNSPTSSSVGPYPITEITGEGGMVWIKSRSAATDNFLFDTERGALYEINSNTTDASTSLANSLTNFNANGFSIGSATGIGVNAATYASWTFRKAKKFFDIVTYTGNGSTSLRSFSHNLGVAPGMIITKNLSNTQDWVCWHRGLTSNNYLIFLNSSSAQTNTGIQVWDATDTTFSIHPGAAGNVNGEQYVVYLFAHDATSAGVIQCGYTNENVNVDLGWEPQWLLMKTPTATFDWEIHDNMRAFNLSAGRRLFPNTSAAEYVDSTSYVRPNSTGFSINSYSGSPWIYVAIRRGPMRTPTSGTSVFSPNAYSTTGSAGNAQTTGFPVDWMTQGNRSGGSVWPASFSRLQGGSQYLQTSATAAEATQSGGAIDFASNTNFSFVGSAFNNGASSVSWSFRRAPGFFDVVCFTSSGSTQTEAHNLSVPIELAIFKPRSTYGAWSVFGPLLGSNFLFLNYADSVDASPAPGFSSTSSNFTIPAVAGGISYVAYLFASCPGVSKVGSFTGTGSTLQVNCGFTGGARFVLIKSTSTTGDWYVWDTARGIVSGNDPYLLLNSTAAEVTTTDWIDTYSSGFELSSASGNLANTNGVDYIFLAIA